MPVEIMSRKRILLLLLASDREPDPTNHYVELLARTCMNKASERLRCY